MGRWTKHKSTAGITHGDSGWLLTKKRLAERVSAGGHKRQIFRDRLDRRKLTFWTRAQNQTALYLWTAQGPKNLIHLLKKIGLRVYSVGHRRNDFSGAHDYFDIWSIDEFTDDSNKNEYEKGISIETWLTLLDGQECRLDAKYERTILKKANVPIILIGNSLPWNFKDEKSPLSKRIIPLKFQTHCSDLDEGRIAATLYSCMCLRASYYLQTNPDPILK